jgi:RNA polymerase sigma-70 factor (ECF subfamily)
MTSHPTQIAGAISAHPLETAGDDLVDRARLGDTAAITELYDRYENDVRAFARHLVGDPMIAEDLVHEAFVSLPKALRSFREESSLRTLILSIAANQAKHHVRAAARRRHAIERLALEAYDAPLWPSEIAERKQLASALNRALDDLPLDQRVAFVLSAVEERSSKEIGEIVGAPEATVRTRVMHARRKLQDLLSKRGVR